MQSSRMRLMQRGVHSSGQPQGCGLHTHPVDVEVVQPADTRKYYPIQQLLLTCPDSSCRLLAYTQHVVMLQQKHSYQQQLRLTCPDSSYCPLSRRAVRCWTLACTQQGRRRAIRLQLVQTQACHSATHRRAAAGMPLCCTSGQRATKPHHALAGVKFKPCTPMQPHIQHSPPGARWLRPHRAGCAPPGSAQSGGCPPSPGRATCSCRGNAMAFRGCHLISVIRVQAQGGPSWKAGMLGGLTCEASAARSSLGDSASCVH